MTDGLSSLLSVFVEHYDVLKRRLTYRLGSSEMAGDVLHDTYVKLAARQGLEAPVSSPRSFLLRTAMNAAIDRIRADNRLLYSDEIEQLLDPDEQGVNPADAAIARIDLEAVARVMDRLPRRQRQLLFASRVDGTPQRELAQRYGISLRRVESEIRAAHDFCVAEMRKNNRGEIE
jgi:RNA polymerase sigma factor (sigma-70 family)